MFLRRSIERNIERGSDIGVDYELLCRFVLDGQGKKIGESIALFDDILIIKSRRDFLGIPIKHVKEEGNHLIAKGVLDQSKALELGAKWQNVANKVSISSQEEK